MKNTLSSEQAARLSALAALPDNTIDFSDIPRTTAKDWDGAARGKFYRPIKEATTVRIDADVKAWLKSKGKGYQTKINEILRLAMLDELKQSH
ncbi:MAG: BrnA antitoxin family protein [Agitococcus sp.]|nr:BrnA antitoxin family protein [Agitococcus sp.]